MCSPQRKEVGAPCSHLRTMDFGALVAEDGVDSERGEEVCFDDDGLTSPSQAADCLVARDMASSARGSRRSIWNISSEDGYIL